MLLAAAAALLAQEAAPQPPVVRPPDVGAVRTLQLAPTVAARLGMSCNVLLHRADGSAVIVTPPAPAGERVQLHLLLDRHIDGCPTPLIAAERIPAADAAIGRNLLAPAVNSPR